MNQLSEQVPLMFRAQIVGRCQLQYINEEKQVQRWVSEWVDRLPKRPYRWRSATHQQTRNYTFNWRFVTNGGQDDGIIRPAIGTDGLPFYPGSSMKGAFRHACNAEQVAKYCGRSEKGSHKPGRIPLRFHGGYPANNEWRKHLIDLVHPQQGWQVKTHNTCQKPGGESAFALISLYKPEFRFCISSPKTLTEEDWAEVWQIWDKAIASGLGCRTSAGYGQVAQSQSQLLYKTQLTGRGAASKLLDEGETPEFRPNCFRAALRGHALRLFGGLCDREEEAESLVEQLFGGVTGGGTAGLLGMNWQDREPPDLGEFGEGYGEPTYKIEGKLRWNLTRSLDSEGKQDLKKLIASLTRFAMLFGGFGKSWRRSDHRLFFPEYYERNEAKPLIGCHWDWLDGEKDNKVKSLSQVGKFIDYTRKIAATWMRSQGKNSSKSEGTFVNWRESWHPDNVQVWGREAEAQDDCTAIRWFHQPYQKGNPQFRIPQGTIKRSPLTGSIGQISRLWHRMYPVTKTFRSKSDPDRIIVRKRFLELLVVFPDALPQTEDFLNFLRSRPDGFELLWGNG
jgi:CRISPR-associated protein Cmr6